MQYELKLSDGTTVVWEGTDAANAIARFQDHARSCGDKYIGVSIVAWRTYPRVGVFVGGAGQIVE